MRKMTSLPAQVLGFKDRGVAAPGYMADAVVFDPDTFTDKATFDDPWQHPQGLKAVLINGTLALENDEPLVRDLGHFLTPAA